MIWITIMSFVTIILCVAFFCELNGNVCGKQWDRFKENFNPDNDQDDYSEMYNDGH